MCRYLRTMHYVKLKHSVYLCAMTCAAWGIDERDNGVVGHDGVAEWPSLRLAQGMTRLDVLDIRLITLNTIIGFD